MQQQYDNIQKISIHALREEGDPRLCWITAAPCRFQSTPSARRATETYPAGGSAVYISIHALREEGDLARRCKGDFK